MSTDQPTDPTPARRDRKPPARSPQPPTYTSEELFAGTKEVLIWHREEPYRLRITKNGKLILHK